MKTIVSLLLGAVSSALLSLGFANAAAVCDPHLHHSAISAASNASVADSCVGACYLIQQQADRSSQA